MTDKPSELRIRGLLNLTSEELTLLSDILRRIEPARRGLPIDPVGSFAAAPGFDSVLEKIEAAKLESYEGG